MTYHYYNNKHILITGGLGFLGSNLATRLVAMGAKVTLLDNLNPLYGGNKFNVHGIENAVSIVYGDVRDENVLLPLVKSSEIIFHFAAQVSYIDSLSMPFDDLEINGRATLQLLELCRKHNPRAKILFSSSRMVLGKIEAPRMMENSPTNPLSLYGIHKLMSEKYLLMYYKDFGIPCVILRITNPYGPRQQIKHSKYSIVGWFVRQAMEGKTIKIFGEGKQLRDYIYVEDIIEAFLLSAMIDEAVGEVINLGSGEATEFRTMVQKVIRIVENGALEYVDWPKEYELIETGDVAADVTKLNRLTNWKPRFRLQDGIRLTYEYYKQFYNHYIGQSEAGI